MDHVWEYYNTLPTLSEENEKFSNRVQTFSALTNLLKTYDNQFGVCLVHAHCTLAEGEIMLAQGDVSQPVNVSNAGAYYAERWLPSGKPYEFTVHSTQTPPPKLIENFQVLTGNIGVLGLYYLWPQNAVEEETIQLEWTEGRKNKVRQLKKKDWEQGALEAAWALGRGEPVTIACILFCSTATTDSGGYHLSESVR